MDAMQKSNCNEKTYIRSLSFIMSYLEIHKNVKIHLHNSIYNYGTTGKFMIE